MAITYVGVRQGSGLATAEPTGTTADDIVLALFNSEDNNALSVATGFTLIDGYTYSGIGMQTLAYWARRGGSAVATNWSGPGGISMISTIAYRGCKTTGTPVDVFTKNRLSINPMTWSSVTTTAANDMIVGFAGAWNWGDITSTTWANERMDGGGGMPGHIFDQGVQASAGATGTRTAVWGGGEWDTITIALLEDTGGGGPTYADGPPTIIGQDAPTIRSYYW